MTFVKTKSESPHTVFVEKGPATWRFYWASIRRPGVLLDQPYEIAFCSRRIKWTDGRRDNGDDKQN